MEYYSAIKTHEVLIHATTWMKLQNVTLSKGSQSQKATHCMFLL
jgi:hypothetical protein